MRLTSDVPALTVRAASRTPSQRNYARHRPPPQQVPAPQRPWMPRNPPYPPHLRNFRCTKLTVDRAARLALRWPLPGTPERPVHDVGHLTSGDGGHVRSVAQRRPYGCGFVRGRGRGAAAPPPGPIDRTNLGACSPGW